MFITKSRREDPVSITMKSSPSSSLGERRTATSTVLIEITPRVFCARTHLDLRNPHVLLQKSSRDARVGPVSPTNEPPRETLGPEPCYFHQRDDVVLVPIIIASNKGSKQRAGCVERRHKHKRMPNYGLVVSPASVQTGKLISPGGEGKGGTGASTIHRRHSNWQIAVVQRGQSLHQGPHHAVRHGSERFPVPYL